MRRAQIDIGLRHIGCERDLRAAEIRRRRPRIRARADSGRLDAAEQRDLPRDLRPIGANHLLAFKARKIACRQIGPLKRLPVIAAREGVDLRQIGGDRGARERTGFAYAQRGEPYGPAILKRVGDKPVQKRIVEAFPPIDKRRRISRGCGRVLPGLRQPPGFRALTRHGGACRQCSNECKLRRLPAEPVNSSHNFNLLTDFFDAGLNLARPRPHCENERSFYMHCT